LKKEWAEWCFRRAKFIGKKRKHIITPCPPTSIVEKGRREKSRTAHRPKKKKNIRATKERTKPSVLSRARRVGGGSRFSIDIKKREEDPLLLLGRARKGGASAIKKRKHKPTTARGQTT